MKVIIAGADGFVGGKLRDYFLKQGHEVLSIVPDCFAGTLENAVTPGKAKMLTGEYDLFYSLAWIGVGGKQQGNVEAQVESLSFTLGYYRLAERLKCKRFISVGTVGENFDLTDCEWSASYRNMAYILAKNATRKLLIQSAQELDTRVAWVRLGTVYGEGMRGETLLSYTVGRLLKGKYADFGPAMQYYDFIHVDDVVAALVALGQASVLNSTVYYAGSGNPRPLCEWLLKIGHWMGCPQLIRIGQNPDDGMRYQKEWFSIEALVKDAGFSPQVAFEQGVLALRDHLRGRV